MAKMRPEVEALIKPQTVRLEQRMTVAAGATAVVTILEDAIAPGDKMFLSVFPCRFRIREARALRGGVKVVVLNSGTDTWNGPIMVEVEIYH